ncbi:la-related protein 1C-like [Coffea arabica]|uniref:La-related protein 1C-like n=1 Tax=Coffea arabica TaxID=13443 RepID=A0A6P6TIE4_COFAR|nr:la-related protein 1C-like [Coffea arabica]
MMATASDPASTAHHSPRGSSAMDASVTAAAGTHSPRYRRRVSGAGAGGVSSPWTQIVRGADSELTISSSPSSPAAAVATTVGISVPPPPPPLSPSLSSVSQEQSDRSPSKAGAAAAAAAAATTSFLPEDCAGDAQPEGSDNGSGGNNGAKKPAWNKPSNGATEAGPVMGAFSWPALSESTRASPKSSSESLKTLSDVSVPVSQATGMASPSAHKQGINANTNSSSTPNHAPYNRQRSMKRGGGSGNPSSNASANGGPSQLPSPRSSGVETGSNNSGKTANPVSDSSHREGGQRGGVGSQSHSGNDHQQQRNSFKRGSGGPRGDGSHHHGYGGRRGDQDRGNQDWNPNRSFGGGRDTHMQSQRVASRPFIRGPHPTPPPFMPPTPMPVRPFGTPIVYPDVPSTVFYLPGPHPESLRAVPMVPPMAPFFFPFPDPQLQTKIVNQIEYYFSNENLVKDTYLRQNMDDQGWVPIKLIASFKKVTQLTDNIQLILDSVRTSGAVEVEGEKVRRRNDWTKWIMPPSVQYSTISSPQSMQKSSQDMLALNFQSMALDEKTAKQGYGETYLSPSSSGEWSSLSQQSSGEKTSQVAVQAGFPTSAPNSSK